MSLEHLTPGAASTVGGRIAQARAFSRLNQTELMKRVGCDRRTVSNWENDHTSPTVEQLLRIAGATGFPATWFIDGIDPRPLRVVVECAPRDLNPEPADYGFTPHLTLVRNTRPRLVIVSEAMAA